MTNGTEDWMIPVEVGHASYLVQPTGDDLRFGQQVGDTVLWQDETVPVHRLPERARAALEAKDAQSADLQRALVGLVEAFAQRGG